MPTTTLFDNINFKILLESIKQQGIAVGVAEIQRLQRVFRQAPSLSRVELSTLLADLLAKDDSQRRTIKHLYDLLIPHELPEHFLDKDDKADLLGLSQNRATAEEIKSSEKPAKKPVNIWWVSLGLLGVIITAIFLVIFLNQPTDIKPNHRIKPQQNTYSQPVAKKPIEKKQPAKLLQTIQQFEPTVIITHISVWQRILPSLLLFIASSLGFIYLLQQLLKRTQVIKPLTPALSGRGRLLLPPLDKQKTFYLLSGEERRSMVWGIDRYLDEAQSNRLDIVKTIQASAKQGLPDIYFQQAIREREIWLWQDQSSQNPDLFRLAKEITTTLKNYNIVVKPAYFQGFPAIVKNKRREIVWSLKHNELNKQPFVLILMDANSLQQSQMCHQDEIHQVFNSIRQWDIRSAVVDCNPQFAQLCQLLKPFELECLKPNELAAWLAQQEHKNSSPHCPQEELERWAMACAVANRVVLEDEIRDIHQYLKLGCTLQYKQLQQFAKIREDGFDFSVRRSGLIKNLANYARQNTEFVEKVMSYWLQRYQQIDKALSQQQYPARKWQDSQHQYNLHIEIALLQLWDNRQVSIAVNSLFSLYQLPKLFPYIKKRLGNILFVDFPTHQAKHLEQDDWLKLPVSWKNIDSNSQLKLLKMGLGGEVYQQLNTAWDQQSNRVLGSLAGAMLISLAGLVYFALPKPALIEGGKLPLPNGITQVKNDVLLIGTTKHLISYPLETDTHLRINWKGQKQTPARLSLNTTTELWLAGTKEAQSKKRFTHSVAILAYPKENKIAQQLAIKLLDTATADQVIFGKGWQQALKQWDKNILGMDNSQWLYFFPADYKFPKTLSRYREHSAVIKGSEQAILNILTTKGKHTLSELSQIQSQILGGNPLLLGKSTIKLAHNLELILIPKGQFKMGSDKGEDDEKPIHNVVIQNDFYMSKTEITFEQYNAYTKAKGLLAKSSNTTRERLKNLPVVGVSWSDPQGYSKWLSKQSQMQCRLPSEAEWEYAARAGTTTAYFWGEEKGKNNANCDGCGSKWDKKQTAPVASFAPNAFGLYDMHGNVREWIQDCYHRNYKNAPSDGLVWKQNCADDTYLLRGGSWVFHSGYARSSSRKTSTPWSRFDSVGFRVVCSLPSEH